MATGGIVLCLWLRTQWISHPDPRDWYNAFFVLFARNEFAGLLVVLALAAATLVWVAIGRPAPLRLTQIKPRLVLITLVCLTFGITALGTSLVFHQYALTADENMPDFQARIFLSGQLSAPVPPAWQPFVHLIKPTYTSYNPATHSWASEYLPVYSLIRALFMSFDSEWLTNPALAALSIALMAAIAGKLWPASTWKPILAAALLATSSQFLLMSMTSYAMPAHLALNLLWLWLYLAPEKRRFWLTPFVGVAALGLHQPFFHALFVLPFLLKLVWDRRWFASVFFAVVYFIGIAVWIIWWRTFLPGFVGGSSPSAFRVHRLTWLIQSIYFFLLVGWLAFPLLILTPFGFGALKRQTPIIRCAAASCLLTFGFYVFVRQDQSHGWGDRYFHGELGCLILLAVVGWDVVKARAGRDTATSLITGGVLASLLLQLPLRAFQAETFVRPYADAAEAFHHVNASLLIFDPTLAWYSADLRRNDPFLANRPVIMTPLRISKDQVETLEAKYPNTLFVKVEGLTELQLPTMHYR
ncbi:MAG: hypothetical protein JO354_12195 [Verrucomicrobia bacterium]|nr:hypothetical protein [Verrucomicrobiota bacterium]